MTGVARLSSARGVSCALKWVNERNPRRLLDFSDETALIRGRKVWMTSSQRGPYTLGYTRATMAPTKGLQSREAELIPSKGAPVRIEGCNSPS